MFFDELSEFKKDGILVEVYEDDRDLSKFYAGYIVACDADFFIMSLISPRGRFDGFMLQEIQSIVSISHSTKYLKQLIAIKNHHNTDVKYNDFGSGDLLYGILEYAQNNNRIAIVELLSNNKLTSGYVIRLDNEKCTVRQIAEDGDSDGDSTVLLDDITQVNVESESSVELEILARYQNSN